LSSVDESPVTVITGTSRGIGAHLVRHYVGLGHRVVGCSRRDVDWGLDGYTHFALDVSDEGEVKRLFADTRQRLGRVDHLINNAGIASMNHSLVTPVSTVHDILNTNLVGAFLFCREAAKQMKKRGYGRIVNFSTVAVPLKLAGEAVYAASKAAVESLTEVLARELAEFGITINAIGPVPTETDLIRSVPTDKIEHLVSLQAIPRLGSFEDIANVVDFFLKPESSMVTGQTVYLGGV
jgi:3-oxoacyl-[acyl-carrier protein] reductase